MPTFFTADTHFGDTHILRQRGAAFASIEAHDAHLIDGWNATVGEADEVWHLGDFAGADRDRCREISGRLNGIKRLVRGNHDTDRVLDLPWAEPPVESLRITAHDSVGTEWRVFLSHYPHRAWPGLWRGARHLYGHMHARIADTRRSCDVGVDAWGYRPIGIEAILSRQDAAAAWPEELEAVEARRS